MFKALAHLALRVAAGDRAGSRHAGLGGDFVCSRAAAGAPNDRRHWRATEDHDLVREFFELFKTPWEFYRPGRRYHVLLSHGGARIWREPRRTWWWCTPAR